MHDILRRCHKKYGFSVDDGFICSFYLMFFDFLEGVGCYYYCKSCGEVVWYNENDFNKLVNWCKCKNYNK